MTDVIRGASPETHEQAVDALASGKTAGTRFIAALSEPTALRGDFAPVANVEIFGPQRIFMVQFTNRNEPSSAARLALFPDIEDVLGTNPGGGVEIDVVDMMTIGGALSSRPIIQRVSSIMERREGLAGNSKYLIVTDAGEIVPLPADTDTVLCEGYQLVFLCGRWISDLSSRRICARHRSTTSQSN
jgi:hypothetical protein